MGRLGTPISCAFATVGLTLRQDWLKTKELLLLSLSKKRIAEQRLVCRRCSVSRRTTSDRPNQQGWTTDRLESSQPISDSPRGFHGYASCPGQIAPETSGMGQDYNAVLQSPCCTALIEVLQIMRVAHHRTSTIASTVLPPSPSPPRTPLCTVEGSSKRMTGCKLRHCTSKERPCELRSVPHLAER